MSWIPLASRLGLEIALGYLVFLRILGPAPVGRFFYRLTGGTAVVAALLAGLLDLVEVLQRGEARTGDALRLASLAVLVLVSGLVLSGKPRRRRRGLAAGIAALGLSLAVRAFDGGFGAGQLAADLAGAAVAGGSCFAMVFGHGYLTVPRLPLEHLQRIQRALEIALILRTGLSLLFLGLAWEAVRAPDAWGRPGPGMAGWLDLGVRYGAGLFLPLLLSRMTGSSLRYRNTQSATGILYAMTIMVWIGEALALHLERQWGTPL